jgi:hypothetical protein
MPAAEADCESFLIIYRARLSEATRKDKLPGALPGRRFALPVAGKRGVSRSRAPRSVPKKGEVKQYRQCPGRFDNESTKTFADSISSQARKNPMRAIKECGN